MMKENEDNYSLIYKLEIESGKKCFSRKDIEGKKRGPAGENYGACDALVVISLVREGDDVHKDNKSFCVLSADGFSNGSSIPDTELFQAMATIANELITAKDADIPEWQRRICQKIIIDVRMNMNLNMEKFKND